MVKNKHSKSDRYAEESRKESFLAQWLDLLRQYRLIAVIRSQDVYSGLKMAQAVADAGICLIEVTWNSFQPQELINLLRQELPHCHIGAGTILTVEHLERAVDCGAQFLFSPHGDSRLIQSARDRRLPLVPGGLSPTEIVTAYQSGATCVKVFPIQSVGGVGYLKSLQGPLGNIPLIPTGGVTLDSAVDFIRAGAIAVGLSSQLFPQRLILNGDWHLIAERARNFYQDFQLLARPD